MWEPGVDLEDHMPTATLRFVHPAERVDWDVVDEEGGGMNTRDGGDESSTVSEQRNARQHTVAVRLHGKEMWWRGL